MFGGLEKGSGVATRRSGKGHGYIAPEHVDRLSSNVVGVTNGLFLSHPYVYVAGDTSLLNLPRVAVVGSRKISDDGRKRAAKIAKALVKANVVVVSGLAEGVDFVAHTTAIEVGGKTIAVIGTPLEKAYPAKHARLQETIYREHLLLSPFDTGTRTFPSHFPERNKIMARMTRATVIVEAGDTSGTLHQAAECVRVGRPLFIVKSVVDNSELTWPARFVGQPNVHVLEDAEQVIAITR